MLADSTIRLHPLEIILMMIRGLGTLIQAAQTVQQWITKISMHPYYIHIFGACAYSMA